MKASRALCYLLAYTSLTLIAGAHAQPSGFEVRGIIDGENFANEQVLFPGDVNGDSVPDIITGAADAESTNGAADSVGRVLAISGRDGAVIWQKLGNNPGDSIGSRDDLALLPDVNGDNVRDLLVSSHSADFSGMNNIGYVEAVSGSDGSLLYRLEGSFDEDNFSSEGLLVVEDLNGDDLADFLVTSRVMATADGLTDVAGNVRAISSADGSTIFDSYGNFRRMFFGQRRPEPAGDLNGDDIQDFIAGSPFAPSAVGLSNQRGYVRAISGADGQQIFERFGSFNNDRLGSQGGHAPGDLNGDLIPDVVFAAPEADSVSGSNDDRGTVMALSGADGSLIYQVFGDEPSDRLGRSVFAGEAITTLPDLNNDQVPELAIAAPFARDVPNGFSFSGLLRVISGADGSTVFDVRGLRDGDILTLNGALFPGDLNGDSIPDILLMSEEATSANGDPSAGTILAASGLDGTLLWEIYGDAPNDKLGTFGTFVVSDLNGDGISDIFSGTPFASSTGVVGGGLARAYSGADGTTLFSLTGEFEGDALGARGFFFPGDLDGDQIEDVVIPGAFASSVEGANDQVGLIRAISGANGSDLFTVRGSLAGDNLGDSGVLTPGDLSGDGTPDLVVTVDDTTLADGNGRFVGLLKVIIPETLDFCPEDPNKLQAGVCGCGVADVDSDGDLRLDCLDGCPNDPAKTEPLVCGCNNTELCSCTQTTLAPARFTIDGTADTLRDLVKKSLSLNRRMNRNDPSCTRRTRRGRNAIRRQSEDLFLSIWELTWGTLPEAATTCQSNSGLPCGEISFVDSKASIASAYETLAELVTDTLSRCSRKRRRGKKLLRQSRQTAEAGLEALTQVPESTLVCITQ